ncbi:hypothetical protein FPRO05_03169 [Fusarium proliferatum]|uniref:BZIP domain-containing protein n=1 Tax=Gibberella intermedia TaxID=948311 RepID=A0A365N0P2_GIBIN|nr:hypothetical protein FPRO05_03169 [Fusarium proliferatum]
MALLADWGIDTQNEHLYGLYWGDNLHQWDWQISSNTLYNIYAIDRPLISPSSSEYRENDAITSSMPNDEGSFSAPLTGFLPSTRSVADYSHPGSQKQQSCLYEETTMNSVQDCHENSSAANDSIPSSAPNGAEPALATGPGVSASIKTRTNAVTETEGKKRNGRKPSEKKKARRTKTEVNKEKEKGYLKILERNRRAAANCRARKQEQYDKLNAEVEKLQDRHKELSASCNELRETAYQLKLQLLRHGECGCALIQRYIASEAVNSVETLISRHSPSSSPNCTTIVSSAASAGDGSSTRGLGGNKRRDEAMVCSHETGV